MTKQLLLLLLQPGLQHRECSVCKVAEKQATGSFSHKGLSGSSWPYVTLSPPSRTTFQHFICEASWSLTYLPVLIISLSFKGRLFFLPPFLESLFFLCHQETSNLLKGKTECQKVLLLLRVWAAYILFFAMSNGCKARINEICDQESNAREEVKWTTCIMPRGSPDSPGLC